MLDRAQKHVKDQVVEEAIVTGSLRVLGISEFYQRGTGFLKEMKDRYLLFKQAKPIAVVMAVDDYKNLIADYDRLKRLEDLSESSEDRRVKQEARP